MEKLKMTEIEKFTTICISYGIEFDEINRVFEGHTVYKNGKRFKKTDKTLEVISEDGNINVFPLTVSGETERFNLKLYFSQQF